EGTDDRTVDTQIAQLLELVGLGGCVRQFGLDGVMAWENTLSGGEHQRLAFARVLVNRPKLAILDEATSSIDSESEQWIQRATEALTSGRTSLLVAHRLNTVRDADRIVVLHQGELVEQGTHEELVALGNVYHRLFEMQFQALEGEG
ncbi:MAG: ATP-binding cassette domain-containing protein, partial [Flavobacteriales bacterium]|nr:ATP-binding cassette domain-containing protein [Flavobacteriales bacterium]